MGHSWEEFMRELEDEIEEAGPTAVLESETLRARYRLASDVTIGRKSQKMTQQALAKASGIDQAEISRIENAQSNPTLETIVRVLTAVGLRLDFEGRPVRRRAAATRQVAPSVAHRGAKRRRAKHR